MFQNLPYYNFLLQQSRKNLVLELNTSVSVLCNVPGECKLYWDISCSFTSSVSSGKDLLHNIRDHYPQPPPSSLNMLQSRLVALLELKA